MITALLQYSGHVFSTAGFEVITVIAANFFLNAQTQLDGDTLKNPCCLGLIRSPLKKTKMPKAVPEEAEVLKANPS